MPGENVHRSTKAASRLARELQASTPHIPPETARQLAQLASTMQASMSRIPREALPSAESFSNNARIARALRRHFNPEWSDENPASAKPELEQGIEPKLEQGIVDKWDVLFNDERTWPDRRWPGKCPVSREEARLVVKLRREGVPGERGLNYGRDAICDATKTRSNGWLSPHKVRWVYRHFPRDEYDAVRSIWQAAQQPPR